MHALHALRARFRRLQRFARGFRVFLQYQHAIVVSYDLQDQVLPRLLGFEIGGTHQVLRSSLVKQSLPRIEQHPLPIEARLEIVEWSWCVQVVQRKIGCRKLALRQLGPEHVHRVIPTCEVLAEIESWIPCCLRLFQPCPRRLGLVGARLECRILLQRQMHRLLQRERLSRSLFLRTCQWRQRKKQNHYANLLSRRNCTPSLIHRMPQTETRSELDTDWGQLEGSS